MTRIKASNANIVVDILSYLVDEHWDITRSLRGDKHVELKLEEAEESFFISILLRERRAICAFMILLFLENT